MAAPDFDLDGPPVVESFGRSDKKATRFLKRRPAVAPMEEAPLMSDNYSSLATTTKLPHLDIADDN
jgi:hypothetical protein